MRAGVEAPVTMVRCPLSAVIVHPETRGEERHAGEDRNDREQHPGERGGIPHAEEREGLLIKIEGVEQRRVDRIAGAARDDERRREALEAFYGLDDGVEEHHRRQHRQRDLPEDPPFAGTFHAGGLVDVLWYLAQTGEEYDHRRAELPNCERD